jgi:hypothetical protein
VSRSPEFNNAGEFLHAAIVFFTELLSPELGEVMVALTVDEVEMS